MTTVKNASELKPTQRKRLGQTLGSRSDERRARMDRDEAAHEARREVKQEFEPPIAMDDDMMKRALDNPVDYARIVLGVDVYPKQKEILEALRRYPRVAVKGCNSSGKTYSMALYVLWALSRYDVQAVMDIAPTGNQSRHVHWQHMNSAYNRSPAAQDFLGRVPMRKMSIDVTDSRYAHAVTPADEMSLRGYHAERLLFVLDEGNGVDADFFDSIRGISASGDVKVIQLGNPTDTSGLFYDTFHDTELGWYTITISAFDSPNISSLVVPDWFKKPYYAPGVDNDDHAMKLGWLRHLRQIWLERRDSVKDWNDIPEYVELKNDVTLHQTTRQYVADGIVDWAEKGNMVAWYSRILGEFPPEGERQLLKREWVMQAARDWDEWDEDRGIQEIVWGVDPAGQGEDEFSLIGIEVDAENTWDCRVIVSEGFHGEDAYDKVKKIIEPYLPRTRYINVDRIGVGEQIAVDLTRWVWNRNYPDMVYSFVSQARAFDRARYKDIKSEAYFGFVRAWMEDGRISGLKDPILQRQLLSLLYDETPTGQVSMESKKEIRKRHAGSPDRADAMAMAMFPTDMYWHSRNFKLKVGA